GRVLFRSDAVGVAVAPSLDEFVRIGRRVGWEVHGLSAGIRCGRLRCRVGEAGAVGQGRATGEGDAGEAGDGGDAEGGGAVAYGGRHQIAPFVVSAATARWQVGGRRSVLSSNLRTRQRRLNGDVETVIDRRQEYCDRVAAVVTGGQATSRRQ